MFVKKIKLGQLLIDPFNRHEVKGFKRTFDEPTTWKEAFEITTDEHYSEQLVDLDKKFNFCFRVDHYQQLSGCFPITNSSSCFICARNEMEKLNQYTHQYFEKYGKC